jgi:3-hydroxyacyl-CoA dehydrogenase / enoyl-CoA hydratase / 3-hydroxybutyryl-CoA epimerase
MAGEGRMGRKAKAGFYAYDEAGKRTGLWEGLAARYPVATTSPTSPTVQHRLMMAQVLEAVRALEEGVLTDIREGDVGAILGWGFAPWSGGPFSWLDRIGAGAGGGDLRPASRPPTAPASALRTCCATWRRHGGTFYGAKAGPRRLTPASSCGNTPGADRGEAGAEPPRPPRLEPVAEPRGCPLRRALHQRRIRRE